MNGFIRAILFGNYFYGCCAVALSVEATLQQQYPLNPPQYYLLLFCVTVVYYTHAYIAEPAQSDGANKRTAWYSRHRRFVRYSQLSLTVIALVSAAALLVPLWQNILQMQVHQWIILLIFPLVAGLYYGSVLPGSGAYNLRKLGWIKPFVIGFVWAGAVTWHPVIFHDLQNNLHSNPGLVGFLLFIKNFMFITMLCIMFDIKDYAADHNQHLKTLVVQLGLRHTLFYVLIPLTAVGLGTFVLYGVLRHFPVLRILINTIPFVLLIIVAYSLHRRKSILYYLAIIDGLMLVKAVCGTIGITLIK